MKKIFAIFTVMMMAVPMFGQLKLEFDSFGENQSDITARTRPRNDLNGNPAAILKIQIPMLRDALIESNYKVGDQDYQPGEFLVYLAEGAKRVVVKHPDFEPFAYTFPAPLKGKTVYTLVLHVPEEYRSLGQVAVMVSTNATKSRLKIDGETYVSDNGRYELKLKPGAYDYELTAESGDFNPTSGKLTITDDDMIKGVKNLHMNLTTTKSANVRFTSTPGAVITVDEELMDKWEKKSFSLPIGRHQVNVSLPNVFRTFVIDMTAGDMNVDVDLRNRFKIVSPVSGEFSIKPIGDALPPTVSKFKAGEELRLLGSYELTAKNKGYDQMTMQLDLPWNIDTEGKVIEKMVPMKSKADRLQESGQYTKAEKEYKKLVKDGTDDIALLNYGKILMQSGRIYSDGSEYIKKSAALGNPDACYWMAENAKDDKAAEAYYKRAAEGGIGDSWLKLGRLLFRQKRYEDAYKALEQDNSSEGAVLMAASLSEIKGASQGRFLNAIERLKKVSSNDNYYGMAQSMLGHLYFHGLGVAKNVPTAMKYWKGLPPSSMVYSGDNLILAAEYINDKQNAAGYLAAGNVDSYKKDFIVYSGISLSKLLATMGQYHSVPNTKDYKPELAAKYLKKAFDLGDHSQTTLRILGKAYKDGAGVAKDTNIAKTYLENAVKLYNDPDALRWLGNIYENAKQNDKAEDYYARAIEQGDVASLGFLGTLRYNSGQKAEGVDLWKQAAQKGHRASVDKLITYYEKVRRDFNEAKNWKKFKDKMTSTKR